MVRTGRSAILRLLALWTLLHGALVARGQDAGNRIDTQLAVQAALQQGRDNLQRGNYQAAVYCLEKEIARVDGNRAYVNALCEAYRGYVRDLIQTNRVAEARTYQNRLKILDPGYQLEMKAAETPGLATLAAQARPAPAAVQRSTPQYVARPQMPDEHDPFAEGNSTPSPSGGDELQRAKREYENKHYSAANQLFAEANRLDSRSAAPYREYWAFCKLFVATEAVNQAGWVCPPEAEKEVLAALALTTSPELERQGKAILRAMRDRRVEIRHVAASGKNWPEAETANFRVIYYDSRDLAEQVARIAETTRSAMLHKWFGDEAGPWTPKCKIFLYPNADYYARQTRQRADSPGHSTLQVDKENPERVVERKIELHSDVADMLTNVLPHETTHAVLLGRFGRHFIPRWADEGMAILSEPREKVERYFKTVSTLRTRHELFSASELMNLKDYPDSRRITPFYVQSASLVEYLCSQKGGPREFARFVRTGLDAGYDTALQRHYGIKDFKELEERWSQAASESAALVRPSR